MNELDLHHGLASGVALNQIIWYRDHPVEPQNYMQWGQLLNKEGKTCKQYTWKKVFRGKFWNYYKENKSGIVFINVSDKTIRLCDVVQQHQVLDKFCKRMEASGSSILDRKDGTINKIIMNALIRSICDEIKDLLCNPNPMLQKVINSAIMGGITYGEKGWAGEAWKYDITSCYPSIMSSVQFPLGEAVWNTISHLDEIDLDNCAFILAEITDSHFLMRNTTSGKPLGARWYTNVDLRIAKKLGLGIALAMPDANYIEFTHEASGADIFGTYINSIFPFKRDAPTEEEKQFAKLLLNKLFGLLAKKKYRTYGNFCDKRKQDYKPMLGDVIIDKPSNIDGSDIIVVSNWNNYYSYPNFCIFAPFITAYARERLLDLMIEHDCISNIKQIHTDGWILDREVHWNNNPDPKALGGIKLEYHGFVTVHHCNNVVNANGIKLNALN